MGAGARRHHTLIFFISSRAPEVAVLRGGAPGRPAQGAGQVYSSPEAAALSGGRGEYRCLLPRLWAAAGLLRKALRDAAGSGASLTRPPESGPVLETAAARDRWFACQFSFFLTYSSSSLLSG